MEYNMSFQFAALAIMVIVLHHFQEQQSLNTMMTRFFLSFVTLGIFDVLFDIATTVMMVDSSWDPEFTKFMLTVFYLLQVLVPYILVAYEQSLRNTPEKKKRRMIYGWTAAPILMGILVLLNYRYGMMFYFTAQGVYHEGPWYMLMYSYALVMAGIVAVSSLIYAREFGKHKLRIIWEFLLLEAICTGIQAFDNNLLMTSFGLGLGVLILYLTLNNPRSYMDNLTGAYDKLYFSSWIQEQLSKKKALHVLAVNHMQMKHINEIYGISVGDELLTQSARIIRNSGASRAVFRISGNCFLLAVDSLEEYEERREKLLEYYRRPFQAGDIHVYFPATICGILNAENLQHGDSLLAYVDYLASLLKGTEETNLIQSDKKLLESFQYRQEAEHYLKTAIEQDLFEVYFQPVYSMTQKQYISVEALTRLRHPTLGMIPPDLIFSITENNGTQSDIGILQFSRICRFVKENEEIMQKIRNIKFNLSPSELLKPEYCSQLIRIIQENGLKTSYFQFEITETAATEYSETLRRMVSLFQDAGIGLCLDDFGSGYANLDMVLRLPFSVVKIDRSLLSGICTDAQSAVFYQSIVLMMQHMGYLVVSEGVETQKEAELLQEWGVDMIQGYYYSRALPGEELKQKLCQEPLDGIQQSHEDRKA